MIDRSDMLYVNAVSRSARRLGAKAIRNFVKRLPALPEHARCAYCGRHTGTIDLPVTAIYNACVWCGFGSNEAERGREGYFDKEKREWVENGEVADRPGD